MAFRSRRLGICIGVAALLMLVFFFGLWTGKHGHGVVLHSSDLSHAEQVPEKQSTSPYDSAADFAKYAMKIREQDLLKVEPQVFAPTSSRPAVQRYSWKTNIVTTVFSVGERSRKNAPPLSRSAWDQNWVANYGGVDNPNPAARRNYIPTSFTPKQNPFYCALPYNDVANGQFKPEAPLIIPWFKNAYTAAGKSVCWHYWVAIRKGARTCYAQWEDCGPFHTDHFQYVFGNEKPMPNANHGAGLNVSPAVRDYLGLQATDVTDWQFVEVPDVPPGPWRDFGENNHFVLATRQAERGREQESLPTGNKKTESRNEPKILDIPKVTKSETDAHGFTLTIHVQKKRDAAIEGPKVKIQVWFYDKVNDKDIRPTDAQISYEWVTPNHDWRDTNTEVLAVNYLRNKDDANAARRSYLGYIVSVYYNDQLQAVRGDPGNLLGLFPPPFVARSD